MKDELQKYVTQYLGRELREVTNSHRTTVLNELDNFEKAIVYKYTEDGYEAVNENLRNDKRIPELGVHLINVMKKLSDYKLLCYRAVKLNKSEIQKYQDALANETVITEKSFLSCSKSKAIALAFCQSPLFIILSKHGKDIEKIAKFGIDSGQNEKEILFKPNSKFRVLEIKQEKDRVTITLEEV